MAGSYSQGKMVKTASFSKKEHLCGEISVNRLFAEGKAFIVYPLRVVYRVVEPDSEEASIKVLISVSKKKFKRAVKRNRVKRLIRESYRLNKSDISEICLEKDIYLHIGFNYLSDELPDLETVQSKMKQVLQKIQDKL